MLAPSEMMVVIVLNETISLGRDIWRLAILLSGNIWR